MPVINTSGCDQCKHGIIDDSNKAKVIVICRIKNKRYYYGQVIPCEDREKKEKDNE